MKKLGLLLLVLFTIFFTGCTKEELNFGKKLVKVDGMVNTELGIIEKSGAWFSYGNDRLGQGRENVKEYFRQNKVLTEEIERKIREQIERK